MCASFRALIFRKTWLMHNLWEETSLFFVHIKITKCVETDTTHVCTILHTGSTTEWCTISILSLELSEALKLLDTHSQYATFTNIYRRIACVKSAIEFYAAIKNILTRKRQSKTASSENGIVFCHIFRGKVMSIT